MLAYSFERLSEELEAAYARLYGEEAGEKSPERLRWRFRDAPGGEGWFAIARDAHAGGTIVGFVGITASELAGGGEAVAAYQAVDLIVDPAYRGRGVFAALGKTLLDGAAGEGGAMVWGFPNDNAAPAWFGRFSWLRFGTAPFLVRPLRSGYFLRRLASPLGRADVRLVGKARKPHGLRAIERFGAETDALWRAFGAGLDWAAERDSRWLNWRFADRPQSAYRSVGLGDGEGSLRALVTSCVLDKHGGRIFYVMEALARPGEERALAALLRHELARAADSGADAALAWCPKRAPNRAAYRRAGFLPLPERLRPVRIHFGAKPLAEKLPAAALEGERWYVSYFDSDTV